jgi:8-oxo-dGTP pyrophosphatase MutT (NUDIX family)
MAAAATSLRQAGVIAYRIRKGAVQVLLVTSRETGRRIIPRGNVAAGSTSARAARREAYEEAGVKGPITGPRPFGTYMHSKRLPSGETRAATVEVYLLRVTDQRKNWPEKGQRTLAWASTAEAIRLVEEPGVIPLLAQLQELEATLTRFGGDPLARQPDPAG